MVERAFSSLRAMMRNLPTGSGASRATQRLVDAWDWKASRSWLSDFHQRRDWVSISTCTGSRLVEDTMGNPLAAELEERGIVLLPDLLTQEELSGMQRAFEVRLQRMRWNDVDGYEKTE